MNEATSTRSVDRRFGSKLQPPKANARFESIINGSGLSTMERSRFIETMQLAGFLACAKPEALAKLAKPVRLPECEAGEAQPFGQP